MQTEAIQKSKSRLITYEKISWLIAGFLIVFGILGWGMALYLGLRPSEYRYHLGFYVLGSNMAILDRTWEENIYNEKIDAKRGGTVIAVNGIKVKNKGDLYKVFTNDNVKTGDEVLYEIERPDKTIEQIKLKTIGWVRTKYVDFVYNSIILAGVYFICGIIIFLLKPHTKISWAFFLLFVLSGYQSFFWDAHHWSYNFLLNKYQFWINLKGLILYTAWVYPYIGYLLPALVFPEEAEIIKRHPWIFWTILFVILLASAGFGILNWGKFTYLPDFFYQMQSVLQWYFLIWLVYISRQGKTPTSRMRARLTLIGLAVALSSGQFSTYTLWVVNSLRGNMNEYLFMFSDIFTLAMPLTLVYVTVKHNLFETPLIIKNTVFYALTIIFLLVSYVFFISQAQTYISSMPYYGSSLFGILYILLLFYLFLAVKEIPRKIINRLFYRGKVDYGKADREVNENLSVIQSVEKLEEYLKDIIIKNLFVESVKFLMKSEKGFSDISGNYEIEDENVLVKLMEEKREIISHTELEENPALEKIKFKGLAMLAQMESAYVLPIYSQNELKGILALGQRKSGQLVFNEDDLGLLKRITTATATLLENTRLYSSMEEAKKELEKLNLILDDRVKQRTAEMEKRNDELESANRMIATATRNKSEFLASMSHELRTPLNGILGYTEIILEGVYGEVTPQIKEVLRDLLYNGKELLQIINEVLDLSKIEAERMDLRMEDFSPRDLVDIVIGTWIGEAEKKDMKIEAEFSSDLPMGWGEGKRIGHVLDVLVRNAVRFSQAGKITIRVTHLISTSTVLLFEIEDNGIGLPKGRAEHLFEEHELPTILDLKDYVGVGLGLAVSKKWIELHHGEMRVESKIGKGTKFSFTLPLKKNHPNMV